MKRIFFLASHKCAGESGGGHGVVYRLHMADKKYHLFQNEVIYIFGDRVITGYDETGNYLEQKDTPKQAEWRIRIKKYIPSFLRIRKMEKMFTHLESYLDQLNKRFNFTDEDIYIFHDFRIARAFGNKFPFAKTAMVYHMQGSIYFEWHAETGIDSKVMRNYYNKIFEEITDRIKYLCFPSKGTEESLVNSEPLLKQAVEKTERKYLYNGVHCPEIDESGYADWITDIKNLSCFKFVTVANLNAAKAVERIPEYLFQIKRAGIPFKWILVGNGVQAAEVQGNIEKYGLSKDVIWERNGVSHSILMELFSVTDFYILLHKYSIFDLSTLEAMHYGNIPILTPVGGNKEIIIDHNGLFVSDFSNAGSFIQLISNTDLTKLKEKNKRIQKENFDDRAFLNRYVELCEKF